ncbi:helix-turn-helix domain-containing protein [Elioraea rosea]|uniref:helix-turn-helix domain-containing protein n=1 Tax=Elioraea rosea TaxID=2492390 RepID=UPI001182C4BD|nr:helix-turn-helix domain-containing protein [Elioraea rosea]
MAQDLRAPGRSTGEADAEPGTAGSVVARVVAVLRAVAETEGSASIKDLAGRVGLAPSTVHRLLDHLAAAEMVERAPHRRYRVSGEFSRIGALAARRAGVLRLAEPTLRHVSDMTGETALLGVLLPQTLTMIFVDKANAATPSTTPSACTATGPCSGARPVSACSPGSARRRSRAC